MKTTRVLKVFFSFSLALLVQSAAAQSILGKWKTIDDVSGEEKSIVHIYEKDGKIFGDIISLINPKQDNLKCTQCKGVYKDKPIKGMTIINGLTKDGDFYNGGTILNPNNGKIYKCRLLLEEKLNRLQVRGYLVFLFKTQYWLRAN